MRTGTIKLKLILVISALTLGISSFAGNPALGLYSSPKGFGANFSISSDGRAFDSFSFYLDTYGVLSGRCLYPGYKFNYSRNIVFSRLEGGDVAYAFYVGPGVTLGYAREYEPYIYTDHRKFLSGNYGAVGAASASLGCRLEFSGPVSIDLGWTVEAGVFIDKAESGTTVSFYRNGVVSAMYPQVIISLSF